MDKGNYNIRICFQVPQGQWEQIMLCIGSFVYLYVQWNWKHNKYICILV